MPRLACGEAVLAGGGAFTGSGVGTMRAGAEGCVVRLMSCMRACTHCCVLVKQQGTEVSVPNV